MDSLQITTLPGAGRIGLLADTHCDASRRLPSRVFEVFAGVDVILHLGDCGDARALEELQRIAPVIATRGGDDTPGDAHYAARRVVEAGGLTVGALFDLASIGVAIDDGRPALDAATIGGILAGAFGRGHVDVVAFAATHQSWLGHCGGVLLVNPGSATLPAVPGRTAVAILDCRSGVASVALEPV